MWTNDCQSTTIVFLITNLFDNCQIHSNNFEDLPLVKIFTIQYITPYFLVCFGRAVAQRRLQVHQSNPEEGHQYHSEGD